ncbi:AAA family ATPase [Flavobacterium akiainvivens]|uniref:AAA family ATPase n=1 Tax=Flavobacterium akiainvivens TaxID=1202724 RepID=A0A0M8MCE6_9FLAO|nr:DNA repair ATPase [Flavobacterium akiainvivens]KOS07235.1 AAA family ATPase [Flavobacterium akiainvivens]SFQ45409.1 AAA domain (dynein-related subfamily) [Flavobacterium akiainvivens]
MSTLEGGTYEIIRSRLEAQKNDLLARLQKLNTVRKEIFGSIETRLIANNRIITENNCIPGDIVSLGNTCIFGYNVHFGLRTDIKTQDVFSIYSYEEGDFRQQDLTLINDEGFLNDFFNLYKYYRDTEFRKFFVSGNYLYMVFQVSERVSDIKTFKWLIKDNTLVYQDNRSDHEYRFPRQHDFTWQEAAREMQRYGKHPHVSILDKVFVETVGGTLTIKVEDNTTTGKGIYDEDVIHPDQTLDDGNFQYADLGNLIALQIKPFQEDPRFFIYNHKLQEVRKIDSLSTSAILLPDQHGLIFSNGYYLQTGEYKIFENSLQNLLFQERITSPNGEDFMYVFYEEATGQYVLMAYNIITHEVSTPIICNGFTILQNGELCYFRAEAEHTKNHLVQIWQTPFIKGDVMPTQHKDSYVYKIGNKDIVKAMAESHSIITLLNKSDDYDGLYADLTRLAQNVLDGYYWITGKETFELSLPLTEIKNTANAAIDEFEKVVQLRLNAAKTTQDVKDKAESLFIKIKSSPLDDIDVFVADLAGLRALRGEVISLKEVRYVDEAFINELEAEIVAQTEHISQNCVQFLMDDKALVPYHNRVAEKQKGLDDIATVAQARKLEDEVNTITADLEMLIEIVSNLKIDDTSKSTHIINTISLIFATLNRLKADIKNKVTALGGKEAKADFAAQVKLIDQSIVNALDRATTPEKTDELLNKISVQLEDLEARFADYEEFTESIIEKREEIYAAFEAKKNSLTEARNKKAVAIDGAAARILKNVAAKALTLNSADEINGYFASDLMIAKLRDLTAQLIELEDTGKAEAIETQLKAAREDALRKLKDRQELYEDGENIIRLGKHKFTVNKQPLDLTIVFKEGALNYHLTGTDFYQQIKGSSLDSLQKYWSQSLVSENDAIYRGAYLAYKIFKNYGAGNLYNLTDEALEAIVKEETSKNYTEGYVKGVHDADAFKILRVLVAKHNNLKLLQYAPATRALAQFAWFGLKEETRSSLNAKIKASGSVLAVFPQSGEFDYIIAQLGQITTAFVQSNNWLGSEAADANAAAHYLFNELKDDDAFTVSHRAAQIAESFIKVLEAKGALTGFRRSIDEAVDNQSALLLAVQWVSSYLAQTADAQSAEYLYEVVALLLYRHESAEKVSGIEPEETIAGLAGAHPSIIDGVFLFHYHRFTALLKQHFEKDVPAFEHFKEERHKLTQQLKADLRLHEFMPKVLTSFVRNKLIDQVYLPLFGDNLAKQLGSAGNDRRTDRSGMLLLVSPPGYGKTTLMEYLANRLGLVFMKINGPAIGHEVTSVDPLSATNSAAREELKKLNLALEMGNNVMLYLDDIQHCSPEFLQKFISLADGTRKIEGVYNGQPKTYDMKSKKFCVVMAGNPYTETGEKFRIPDMLANRADIYNLGDVIGNTAHLFELSLIENALTSHPLLAQLASKSMEDLYPLITMAQTGQRDGLELKGNHTKQDIETYVQLLDKVVKVRTMVLQANAAYIASAAMEDAYRTEPPFKLQGSYRDMNKLVAKIDAIMNDDEVNALLLSHYQNETQTLTSAAEANLLKYKEMAGSLNETEKERWASIKETFVQNNKLKGFGNKNEMAQILRQMMEFTGHIEGIKEILKGNQDKV